MPTKFEMLKEANKRGLLSGDKKTQFDEAVKRGLIPSDNNVTAQAAKPEIKEDPGILSSIGEFFTG